LVFAVFGVLSLAVGVGAGAESRRPLGIAIVGGVLFSTFLTLLVVPVVYSLLARFTRAEPIEIEETPMDETPEGIAVPRPGTSPAGS
jgi:HAE1 family hydrophobic/amphiphilic exporter-1